MLPEARATIPCRGRAAQPEREHEGEHQPRDDDERDHGLSVPGSAARGLGPDGPCGVGPSAYTLDGQTWSLIEEYAMEAVG